PDRLFGIDRAVGLDVENELVEIGTLFDARAFDVIGDFTHRAEGSIELQPADGARLLLESHALRRRTITAPALDFQRHRQLAGLGQVRDHEIRIQYLYVVVAGDVARRHGARALLVQAHLGDVAGVHADGHRLQIEQDIDDVFLHALDRG